MQDPTQLNHMLFVYQPSSYPLVIFLSYHTLKSTHDLIRYYRNHFAGTKADWLGSTSESITFCIRLVMIVEITSYNAVQQEIGPFSRIIEGFSALVSELQWRS